MELYIYSLPTITENFYLNKLKTNSTNSKITTSDNKQNNNNDDDDHDDNSQIYIKN